MSHNSRRNLGSCCVFVSHNTRYTSAHATLSRKYTRKIEFGRMQNFNLTFGLPTLVSRRRPIFPESHPSSIVSAEELNFCVRYGNRWILFAITTGIFSALFCFLLPLSHSVSRPLLFRWPQTSSFKLPLPTASSSSPVLFSEWSMSSEPSKLHNSLCRITLTEPFGSCYVFVSHNTRHIMAPAAFCDTFRSAFCSVKDFLMYSALQDLSSRTLFPSITSAGSLAHVMFQYNIYRFSRFILSFL